jgi:hypothetical protein
VDDTVRPNLGSEDRIAVEATRDAELEAAVREVDLTLLRWFRSLPLTARLDWASRAALLWGRLRG